MRPNAKRSNEEADKRGALKKGKKRPNTKIILNSELFWQIFYDK